jgi:hypothetical protein
MFDFGQSASGLLATKLWGIWKRRASEVKPLIVLQGPISDCVNALF